jgi:DNA-binding response OmpR family regulator
VLHGGAVTVDGVKQIIMVDDSDEDHEALARALGKVAPNCTLTRFEGSRDLFEHSPSPVPLIVLLDLNLPGENGLRVLHRLRGHIAWRVVPVVIYSGSRRPEDVAAAYAGGAAGYFLKRFDPAELLPQVGALWTWWAETVQPPRAFDFGASDS